MILFSIHKQTYPFASNICFAREFVCSCISSFSAAFDIYETSAGLAGKGSITHANELAYLISSNRWAFQLLNYANEQG